MAAAKVLAEAGLHIEVYASTESERQNGAPNGIYRGSDGTIYIDLNAGDNGQGTVAYALAHETTHFIKDFSATKYQTYADILIEAAESKGISYDSLLDRQLAKQSALEENRGKTAEELQQLAYDETIAEMSETMLTDTDAAQRVSQELYKQDRTLWEKIKDFFTGLVEKLRSAYKGIDPDSDIGRVMKRAIQDNETVAQAWAEAVVEAGENYQLQDGTGTNAGENSSIRLSPREQATARTLVEQLEEHLQELSQMEAVAEVYGTELNKKLRPVDAAMEFVNSFGGSVTREGFGVVRFSKTKIKSGLVGHGLGNAKMETFAAVPAVIRDGVQIGHADNWKGSHKESFVFAAPVTYKNVKSYVGVIVERDSQSGMYYVHEVVDNNGNVFAFDSKKEESAPDRLLTLSGRGDTVANSSENMVAQDGANVNGENIRKSSRNVRDSEGNALTENQARYFENSEVRDDEGNLLPVYHATDNDFFTFDREKLGESTLTNAMDAGLAATSLVGHWFSDHDTGKQMWASRSIKSYLNIENPYYATLDGLAEEIGGYADDYNQMQEDFENGDYEKVREAAAAFVDYLRNRGYDGLIVDDPEMGGTSYVVLDSEQAKLVSNENPTGNPDIRYSYRNNQESQVDRLARKNEELKAEAEYLRQVVQIQKKGNTRNLRDRESVNAIAKSILESVNAKDTEFGKKLNDFYRDMVTVEMDYDTMQERAGELADRALEHHQAERDGYAQEVLDFLKKRRVSLTDSQIGDAEYTYGSLSEFKKAIKGSIIIDQNSTTSLDQLWQEAAAQFPDRFSADTVAADMR